jgi:hypothetical protein
MSYGVRFTNADKEVKAGVVKDFTIFFSRFTLLNRIKELTTMEEDEMLETYVISK